MWRHPGRSFSLPEDDLSPQPITPSYVPIVLSACMAFCVRHHSQGDTYVVTRQCITKRTAGPTEGAQASARTETRSDLAIEDGCIASQSNCRSRKLSAPPV